MELAEILHRLLGVLTPNDIREMVSGGREMEAAQVIGMAAQLAVAWHERRLLNDSDYNEFKRKHRVLYDAFNTRSPVKADGE